MFVMELGESERRTAPPGLMDDSDAKEGRKTCELLLPALESVGIRLPTGLLTVAEAERNNPLFDGPSIGVEVDCPPSP